jgi:hypothetical protein
VTSVGESERYVYNGFNASLALLQRFVERGIYLLSKKKRRKIHIGILEIHLDAGPEIDKMEVDEFAAEAGLFLDDYLIGELSSYDEETRQREDAQFEMLAGKIDRVQLHANGGLNRDWELRDAVARREEFARRQELARNEDSGEEDDHNLTIGDITVGSSSSTRT